MFCKHCGKEIREVGFCPYCGTKQEKNNVSENRKRFDKRILMGVVLILAILIVFAVNKKKLPELTEEQIRAGVTEAGANSLYLGESRVFLGVDSVEIIEQNYDKNEYMNVLCDITMSDSMISAKVQYSLEYALSDEYWILENYVMENLEYVKPKQGIDENTIDMKESLCGEDTDTLQLFESYMDSSLSVQLIERNTDLDNGTDNLLYEYEFNTHTVIYSGQLLFECIFKDGQWQIADVSSPVTDYQWILEGKWEFDIFTYYVEVLIRSMDWTTMQAEIEYKGSAWQGGGDVYTATVNFVETAEGIKFDTFIVPGSGYMNSGKEIDLLAKSDDMYYASPATFYGEPIYMAIGGKAE